MMKQFFDLRVFCILFAIWSADAVARFLPVNGGMVVQQTVVTTAGGTTTAVATSNQVYVFEGTQNQDFILPNAQKLPIDWWYNVINNSTGTVSVKDAGGGLVKTLLGGEPGKIQMSARASSAGTWKVWPTVAQTNLFFKPDFITSSSGVSSSGFPVKTNNLGLLDFTFFGASLPLTTKGDLLSYCSSATRFGSGPDGNILSSDSTQPCGLRWVTPGAGSVSSISVASANGMAGVSSGGATPIITLSTTVNGIAKGNGTSFSAAVSGTDYAPATSGSAIQKGNGAGGFSSAVSGTDYAPPSSGTGYQKGDGAGGFTNQAVPIPYADGGTNATTAWTQGSVIFAGASGFAQDNANFFWDATNHRLGLGTASPASLLSIKNGPDDNVHGIRFLPTSGSEFFDLYTSGTSTLQLRDPFQNVGLWQVNNQGRMAVAGASIGHPDATFLNENQPGVTGIPTYAAKKQTSQTADFLDFYDTDETTVLFGVSIAGKMSATNIKDSGTGAGVVRSDASGNFTSAELSGDVTTSGSNATTVAKIQGTTVSGTTGTGNVVFSSSPSIAALANLTTNGYVRTSGGVGTLNVDTPATAFVTLYETIATTLGDLVYGGASGTPTRLAGDTSNTKKFLREQSASGVAAAPAWDTIATSDVVLPTTSVVASGAAAAIDWNVLVGQGGAYTRTLAASTTFTFANPRAGQTIVMAITNTASNFTVTWSDSRLKWPGGTTPTQTIGAKTDVYTFVYDGVSIYGNVTQNY